MKISKVTVVVVFLIAASALFARAATQAELQKEAKITMEQAKKTALERANGKIESAELEREHGKLIYSFDIRVPKQSGITEIAVDAITGKIISVQHETPKQETAEKKKEAAEKKQAAKKKAPATSTH